MKALEIRVPDSWLCRGRLRGRPRGRNFEDRVDPFALEIVDGGLRQRPCSSLRPPQKVESKFSLVF